MRMQFTLSDDEYQKIKALAEENGYPNAAEFCKSKSLGCESKNFVLYQELLQKVSEVEKGKLFYIRDLVDTPPALLGRWFHDNVRDGIIPNVESAGSDGTNPEKYVKY